jgi:hypothetical protein
MHKTVKNIIREIEVRGHRVEHTAKHVRALHSSGTGVVILPVSPGGGRWEQNMMANLRRQGFLD